MHNPSRRQLEVLRVIARGTAQGLPPTLSEISNVFGWSSPHAARCHIDVLIRHGLIARAFDKARASVPTEKGWRLSGVSRHETNYTVLREHRCIRCNTATFDPSKPCFECVNIYQVLPAWTAGGIA